MAKNKPVDVPPGPELYRDLLPPAEYQLLLDELARPLPPGLRANPLKIDPNEARARWQELYGWDLQSVPFCSSGWVLAGAGDSPAVRPSQTSEFKNGFFYLQDAASMLPVELFDFDGLQDPLILDLAAAPGGKSTHLAGRSEDRGLLIANDSSFSRIPPLHTALLDWGAMNSLVTNLNGEKFGAWFPDTFDRVLLDAPCSMDNLREAAGRGRRSVSARERQGLAARQVSLLASALAALKPDGQVVYSTCTLAPEEDEGVIDSLLRMFPGKIRLDDASRLLPQPAPGLVGDGIREYSPELSNSLRLWPHIYGTSGFFAARLTKIDSIAVREEEPPLRTFSRLGLESVSRQAQAVLMDRFAQAYGFDLQHTLAEQRLVLHRKENTLLALPERYLEDFASFPVQPPGFPLFEDTREGLIVSHELAARFGLQFSRGRYMIDAELRPMWLRGTDLPLSDEQDYPLNTIVIVVDEQGRYLGRGKVLRDRIKNMIPRRLALN